jgi:hypothetical protein
MGEDKPNATDKIPETDKKDVPIIKHVKYNKDEHEIVVYSNLARIIVNEYDSEVLFSRVSDYTEDENSIIFDTSDSVRVYMSKEHLIKLYEIIGNVLKQVGLMPQDKTQE